MLLVLPNVLYTGHEVLIILNNYFLCWSLEYLIDGSSKANTVFKTPSGLLLLLRHSGLKRQIFSTANGSDKPSSKTLLKIAFMRNTCHFFDNLIVHKKKR